MKAARALADGRSRSPAETRLRLIWTLDAGLPSPRCNWPVADLDGNIIGKPDLLYEELAVFGEYDGAFRRSGSRHRRDVRREDLLRRAGLEGFTVVGADLHDQQLVVERMLAAVRRAARPGVCRAWLTRADPGPP